MRVLCSAGPLAAVTMALAGIASFAQQQPCAGPGTRRALNAPPPIVWPSPPRADGPIWVPAIAISGLTFYTGDKFPNWKNNVFVGGMRQGEVPRSGHLERIDFNDKWEELHRESMLRELQQRIRDVRQGPDGYLYLLTAENEGALMRMEPYGKASAPTGREAAR